MDVKHPPNQNESEKPWKTKTRGSTKSSLTYVKNY